MNTRASQAGIAKTIAIIENKNRKQNRYPGYFQYPPPDRNLENKVDTKRG
jgi:hypothetical protein